MLYNLPYEILAEMYGYLAYDEAFVLAMTNRRMRLIWQKLQNKLWTMMNVDILRITTFDKDEAFPIADILFPETCQAKELRVRIMGRKGGNRQLGLLNGAMHNAMLFRCFYEKYLLIGQDVYNSGWERYAMAHNREIMTAGMRQRGSFLQGATMRRSLVVWQSLGSRHNSVEGTVLPMTDEEKEYIGFDRNGSPVIDLHRLLVYSHIKMIVIVAKDPIEFFKISNALNFISHCRIDKKILHLEDVGFMPCHERRVEELRITATSYPRIRIGTLRTSLKPSHFPIESLNNPAFKNTRVEILNVNQNQCAQLWKVKSKYLKVRGGHGDAQKLFADIIKNDTQISLWEIEIEMNEPKNPTDIIINVLDRDRERKWNYNRRYGTTAIFEISTPSQVWIVDAPDRSHSSDFNISIRRKQRQVQLTYLFLEDEPGTSGPQQPQNRPQSPPVAILTSPIISSYSSVQLPPTPFPIVPVLPHSQNHPPIPTTSSSGQWIGPYQSLTLPPSAFSRFSMPTITSPGYNHYRQSTQTTNRYSGQFPTK
ncbi:hypothetical protein WR25_04715 [Diploscapter pachys]|uniref:F-box domain-containing protein n=1 Tax=Diploscapter pachys TaxID=2018661 RepID=A0A2A2L673_9BILA|nr:hypothetical protein WR25_04715 [Diploscapter pachys]